jgi:hypothetical protein
MLIVLCISVLWNSALEIIDGEGKEELANKKNLRCFVK